MAQGDHFRLRIFINFAAFGWSEVLWLRTCVVDEALAWGFDICNRRRLWFGQGVEIIYAEVSQAPNSLDTWAINTDPICKFPPNLPQPQPPNDAFRCFNYCSTTNVGTRWGFRQIKGMPDDWVMGMNCTKAEGVLNPLGTSALPSISIPPGAMGLVNPPVILGSGLTNCQRSYLDALIRYTGYLTKNATLPRWTAAPFNRIQYTETSKRNSGSEWIRCSCEAGAMPWFGSWLVPDFQFCGLCLGVYRGSAYYAPARWYYGGPPYTNHSASMGIRFYRVPRSNPCYFGQLRFGPKWSEPDYYLSGVSAEGGEITTMGERARYPGDDQVPGRDGTHPNVTARQAAGQEPWPFAAAIAS